MSPRDAAILAGAIAIVAFLFFGNLRNLTLLKVLWSNGLVFFVAAAAIRLPTPRRLALTVSSLFLVLAVFETGGGLWQEYKPGATYHGEDRANRNIRSKELGYRPRASVRQKASKYMRDGTLVYDVTYTIDEHHLRFTPRYSEVEPRKTIFVFGCSVTFGQGVNDDETFPYRLAASTDFKYHVVNFAMMGWGSHQMLRMLELGLPDAMVKGEVKQAFYLMPTYHLNRVAGEVAWDLHGPRYEVMQSDNGERRALYTGRFGLPDDRFRLRVRRSWLWKATRPLWERDEDEKRELAVEIVAESQRILRERYGTELFVIVKGAPDPAERLARALRARGIPNADSEDWVPTRSDPEAYRIRGDSHPNALWHQKMGQAIAERLETLEGS